MYLQFTILLILVNCLLHANSQPPSPLLPYGCVECQKKGGTYCYTSRTSQFCAVTEAYCESNSANTVVTKCSTVPTVCADYNYNCSGCIASSLGCERCITTQDFCVSKYSLAACVGGVSSSDCTVSTTVSQALNCTSNNNCSSCVAANCNWNAIGTASSTKGCSYQQLSVSVPDCTDPTAVCPSLGGTFETRCNCTADPDCGICYGITDSYTNYFCSYKANSASCQSSIYDDCDAPEIICPILINPYDPYGTVCQCTQNPQCTICITNTASALATPQLKCVAQSFIPENTCQNTTTNCADKRITCPKSLSCSACKAAGCVWCDTSDVSSPTSCRAPTDKCANNTFAATTCTTCSTITDCATCNSNSCQWCYSGETGKSSCLSVCSPSNSQTSVTNCAKQDPCSAHQASCSSCHSSPNCTYCEGLTTFDGRNPGFYCTSLATCGKAPNCGVAIPCIANIVTNCSITNICPVNKDCVSCSAASGTINTCSWCSNNGAQYCDLACTPGLTVPSCTVLGPTTTSSWPVYTPVSPPSGGTGSPGTTAPGTSTTPGGIPGTTPTGTTPGGSGTTPGGSGNTPGGTGTPGGSGNTPGGSTPGGSGNTPGGSGNTPGGSGNTPGGSGNTPGGSGNTPGGSGNTPGGSGNTPGGSGNTPGGSGNTPGGSGNTPGGSGNTPGGRNGSTSGSSSGPDNKGITGDGVGVVNGFDFVLFGIIVGVILVVVIIIVIVVLVVKSRAASETV